MAQNITLLGASYSDVPSVTLPKTGGGTASFVDITDTTAEAEDVASGKYFYTAAGVRTLGTASGGGGASSSFTLSDSQCDVYFVDNNGTFQNVSVGTPDAPTPTGTALVGSLVVALLATVALPSASGLSLLTSVNLGSRANYRTAVFYQVT